MSEAAAAQAATEGAAPPPAENEVEVRARRLGWVPKDEFRGDPDKHRSAEEFLERGETLLPILKRDNEKLHGIVSRLEGDLRETKEATKELLAFTGKSEERAYKRAREELEGRVQQAAQNADPAAARQAMDEMARLDNEHRKPAQAAQTERQGQQVDPEIQEWIGRERWFTSSPVLGAYATDIYGELERSKPGMSKSELLAETKRRTQEKFPEKFGINPMRSAAPAVDSPSGGTVTQRKKGKTYEDLPAEAKKACDKFVRTIPGYTREQYVKDYEWD